MKTFYIGCLHLSHRSMAVYRGFKDEWEHDDYLIKQWNSVVTSAKDIVYILGDISMEKAEPYYKLDLLNGIKHVVLGNHDRRQDVKKLLGYVDSVGGAVDHKGFLLTHVPIHPNEVQFYRGNIHAHIHHENKLEEVTVSSSYKDVGRLPSKTLHKYFNVDAKLLDFKPVQLEHFILK